MRIKVTVVAGILGIAALLGSTVTVATGTLAGMPNPAHVAALAPHGMPNPVQPRVMPDP